MFSTVRVKTIIQKIISPLWFISLLFSFFIFFNDKSLDTIVVMKIYGALSIVLLVRLFTFQEIVPFGPSFLIFLYSVITCFGYDVLVLTLGNEQYYLIEQRRHSYTEYYNLANSIMFIGNSMLLFGMHNSNTFNNIFKSRTKNNIIDKRAFISDFEKKTGLLISFIIVSSYTALLIMALATGRLRLIDYASVKDYFSENNVFSYLLRLSWVAIPTGTYYARNRKDYTILAIPIIFMFIILMISGNRNEILYPLSMAVGIYVWKRNHIERKQVPLSILMMALFVIIVINPLISSTRKIGLGLSTLISGTFGFYDAIYEMGSGINTFSITLYALDTQYTSFKYGLTILIPIVALISLNSIVNTTTFHSEYSPTVILNNLGHYGRGYTWICELFLNFGIIGTILFFLILGGYINSSESPRVLERKRLFFFQISPLFMLWARNSFNLNFIIIIFALVINWVIRIITRSKE